jgi:four helix bundle protein
MMYLVLLLLIIHLEILFTMAIQRFQDIIAWQKAQDFAVELYNAFNADKAGALRDQIFKSAVSISNSIAEGYDRKKEIDFSKFLTQSLVPCSEIRSMLFLSTKLNYINEERRTELMDLTDELSKTIKNLRSTLKSK